MKKQDLQKEIDGQITNLEAQLAKLKDKKALLDNLEVKKNGV